MHRARAAPAGPGKTRAEPGRAEGYPVRPRARGCDYTLADTAPVLAGSLSQRRTVTDDPSRYSASARDTVHFPHLRLLPGANGAR